MLKPDRIIVKRRPDPPTISYVELWATSQFCSKRKGKGGVAGHAVIYIKGACKDEKAPSRNYGNVGWPQPRSMTPSTVPASVSAAGFVISIGLRLRAMICFFAEI